MNWKLPALATATPFAVLAAREVRKQQLVQRLRNRLFRMRGLNYYSWLDRFQESMKPGVYLEIGVSDGRSPDLARPPTRAIGVDPSPTATQVLTAETHIFAETSDAFFASRRLEQLLGEQRVALGFIDGLHLFEQALKDFAHLERYCGRDSVILMHDVVPLDEASQERTCSTKLWMGDVWKTVACLKEYRPDLAIMTVATSPSGLAVITNLDPESRVLTDKYDEAVSRFRDLPYSSIKGRIREALNLIPNNWQLASARLGKPELVAVAPA